jgi:HEAT repeat protein
MPTEDEKRVLNLLSAVDYAPGTDPGKLIESWGTGAVTVACEAALGSYPGLRLKVRTNAVAALGTIDHPQAREAVTLLVKEPLADLRIRALRAAGAQKNTSVVGDLAVMLQSPSLESLIAVEVVKALLAIDTPEARSALQAYRTATADQLPHRGNALVSSYLERTK